MKFILFLFIFLPLSVLCQKVDKENETIVSNQLFYGYVNGVRLDSVQGPYAQATITAGMRIIAGNLIRRLVFDVGQHYKDEKEARIMDSNGKVITFLSTAAALNFFDYNGWEFVLLNLEPYGILLKKKVAK